MQEKSTIEDKLSIILEYNPKKMAIILEYNRKLSYLCRINKSYNYEIYKKTTSRYY